MNRGDAWNNGLSSIHGNCVSPSTRIGGPFISSPGSGNDRGMQGFLGGVGVVGGGLERMHHQ